MVVGKVLHIFELAAILKLHIEKNTTAEKAAADSLRAIVTKKLTIYFSNHSRLTATLKYMTDNKFLYNYSDSFYGNATETPFVIEMAALRDLHCESTHLLN